jgi:hypothetical protein
MPIQAFQTKCCVKEMGYYKCKTFLKRNDITGQCIPIWLLGAFKYWGSVFPFACKGLVYETGGGECV